MSYLMLTDEERAALKKDLLDFIHRAASKNDCARTESEIGALPGVIDCLYHFTRE